MLSLRRPLPFVQIMGFMQSMSSVHGDAPLDLQLLVALEALIEHRNVTRAAVDLGITQSAMSHRLRRLRALLDDPVVVPARQGLVPTPRAQRLGGVVSRSLHELRAALKIAEHFDPATSDRTFTVVTSDFAEFEILPRVLEELSRVAPRVSVTMIEPFPGLLEALERGEADLVVGPQVSAPGLIQRKVGEDGFGTVVRRDHPRVGRHLDLDTFVALRHLVINPVGVSGISLVDEALAKLGRRRDVAMRVPHFLGAPFIAARSDLVLTGPYGLLRRATELLPLRLFEPPIELPLGRIFMSWHERVTEDPGHAWLRDVAGRCTAAVIAKPVRRAKAATPRRRR